MKFFSVGFEGTTPEKLNTNTENKKGIIHTSTKKIHSMWVVSGENLEIRIDSFKGKALTALL